MSFSPLVKLARKVERAEVPWGFVIYRTTYTPFSDTYFTEIVQLLTSLAKYSVCKWKDWNPNNPAKLSAKTTLQETYKPIIMDNKSEFDGITLDAIRAHHQALIKQPVGSRERPITNEWCCLLVDEEVVQTLAGADPAALIATQNIVEDYDNHWVKAVESDPEDEDDKGWMKCSVFALWNLWIDMDGDRPMRSFEALYTRGPYCG